MTTDCNTCDHYNLDGLFPEPCRYEVWNDEKGRCSMYRQKSYMADGQTKIKQEATK